MKTWVNGSHKAKIMAVRNEYYSSKSSGKRRASAIHFIVNPITIMK
jgi:hypothetical protein